MANASRGLFREERKAQGKLLPDTRRRVRTVRWLAKECEELSAAAQVGWGNNAQREAYSQEAFSIAAAWYGK